MEDEDFDGEAMEDEDVDGLPMEDEYVDGELMEEDVDGEPMQEEDDVPLAVHVEDANPPSPPPPVAQASPQKSHAAEPPRPVKRPRMKAADMFD